MQIVINNNLEEECRCLKKKDSDVTSGVIMINEFQAAVSVLKHTKVDVC